MNKLCVVAAVAVLTLVGSSVAPAQEEGDSEAIATLKIVTGVVMPDLSVRPIPKFTFEVVSAAPRQRVAELTTGFDGIGLVELPPGRYFVRSTAPLELEDRTMTWNVPVAIPNTGSYRMEISNDNATILRREATRASSELSPEFFARVRESVFTVETEAGQGSGFLVDKNGLVLTNQHVIKGSRYLAVKISETEKYPARLVLEDEDYDLAVLQVNPNCVAGRAPLVAAGADFVLTEGLEVIAVGSPHEIEGFVSTGVVSGIKDGVIYSDVDIDKGNSGGPLVVPTGEVIGVITFLSDFGAGPTTSGIVPVRFAADLVLRARKEEGAPPRDHPLPVVPEVEYPLEAVRNAPVVNRADLRVYRVEGGKFDLLFMTPAVIAGSDKAQALAHNKTAAKGRKKRKGKKKVAGEDLYKLEVGIYDWERYSGRYEPIVTIQAIPEKRMTGGSWARRFIPGIAGGTTVYRFKDDFMKMRLLRNGEEVAPIRPGRLPKVGVGLVRDLAYFGSYTYRPEAFTPGAQLVLEVYREAKPDEPKTVEIPPALVQRIAKDFDSYFDAVGDE